MPDYISRISSHGRITREKNTVAAMIGLFCRRKHGRFDPLCPECQQLLDYANCRLDRCRYGDEKPTCASCPIHCYKPAMRIKIHEVMRYAGPRMILRHPILALLHLVDGRRKSEAYYARDVSPLPPGT